MAILRRYLRGGPDDKATQLARTEVGFVTVSKTDGYRARSGDRLKLTANLSRLAASFSGRQWVNSSVLILSRARGQRKLQRAANDLIYCLDTICYSFRILAGCTYIIRW